MKEKKLKNYLLKAEYIRPAVAGSNEVPLALKRIIKQRKNRTKYILSHLHGVPYKTLSAQKLARLLKGSKLTVLSLDVSNSGSISKSEKVAKAVNDIEKRKNLHLLYYSMIYFAMRKKSTAKWQRPYRYNAALRLKNFHKQPIIRIRPAFQAKFSKITTDKEDLLHEGKEVLEQNCLAMEQEYSDRRNYRNSTPLHT
ncbi:hypothetical protein K0U07_05575 [bacterium]|nr:hypothetical protein [bacterium]